MRSGALKELGVEVVLGQPVTRSTRMAWRWTARRSSAETDHLGRRRPRFAGREMARRRSRPRRPGQGRAGPERARPSRNSSSSVTPPCCQADPRHRRRCQAGRASRGEGYPRSHGGDDTKMPFHYRHLGDIATIGRSRALIDFGWIQADGLDRLVGLGHRSHLLPDRCQEPPLHRAQLAVDLSHRLSQRTADHPGGG